MNLSADAPFDGTFAMLVSLLSYGRSVRYKCGASQVVFFGELKKQGEVISTLEEELQAIRTNRWRRIVLYFRNAFHLDD